MKLECIISHETPGDGPGKFTRYEAGKVYDLDEAEPGYFRAVHGIGQGAGAGGQGAGEGQKSAAGAARKNKTVEG